MPPRSTASRPTTAWSTRTGGRSTGTRPSAESSTPGGWSRRPAMPCSRPATTRTRSRGWSGPSNGSRGSGVLRRGIELSQRSGRRDAEGWLWNNVGNYAFDQGMLAELEEAAEVSIQIGRSLNYPHILSAGNYYSALVAFLRGDLDGAEE